MSDETTPEDEAPPKKGKMGLVVILLAAVLAGGGAFGAVYLGALDSVLGGKDEMADAVAEAPSAEPGAEAGAGSAGSASNAAFHPLEPISVSIGQGGDSRQVRIRVVLEVPPRDLNTITEISPRLQDGILGYLRAIEHETLEDPAALIHLRAQMLRRARLIAGQDAVANLLVTDFVLN